jgi:hypothetical protein
MVVAGGLSASKKTLFEAFVDGWSFSDTLSLLPGFYVGWDYRAALNVASIPAQIK